MNVNELAIKNNFLEEENKKLQEELQKTKDELEKTKEHLKKYTAPANNKIYYEKNKEAHIKRVREYKEKTNYVYVPTQEQKKEWARTAYLNKKAKLKKMEEEKNENI